MRFKDRKFKLNPGDRIFVYTDGVPEATNKDKHLFESDRLKEALDASDYRDPENVCNTVQKYIDEFVDGAEQFDDITMLTFLYKGSGDKTEPAEQNAAETPADSVGQTEIKEEVKEDIKEDNGLLSGSGKEFKTIKIEEITE